MGFDFVSFFPRAVMQGIPLLFGSTGEILTEKSGNLNLGIPGIMYVGGISGVIGSFFYEQAAGGQLNGFLAIMIPILCSLLGSLLMGLLYCFLTVTLRANQIVQTLLIGLVVVDGHLLHGSQDDEHIGVQQLGQQLAAEVLVDDGRGAGELAALADNGDAAAAHGDDHMTGLYQRLDAGLFHDIKGLGGGNDLAIAAAGVLYHGVTLLGGDAVRRLLVVEGAHGLGGILEGGVVLGHHGLGHDGGHRLVHAAAGQLVADGLLQVVADVALGHGAALREGHIGLDGLGLGSGGQAQIDHTHLGAVAVGDDHLVALGDQVHDGLGGFADQGQLLGGGAAQGVAAQRDNDSFRHNALPHCFRFFVSACPL